MLLVQGLKQWTDPGRPLYLALGNFDGVHRGHQLIIQRTVDLARRGGGASAVLALSPHPQAMFRDEPSFFMLTDLQIRAEIISALGVDYFIVLQFDSRLASTSPERFVNDYLWEKLRVNRIVIGEDYSFGREGRGTPLTLERLGREYGFGVETCPLLEWKGSPVSSSLIRSLIAAGKVSEASGMLNYFLFRYGKVIRGAGRGNRLLYPTANLHISPDLLLPGRGVYFTAVEGDDGKTYFGVTNVGGAPTFDQEELSVETHILGYHGYLYQQTIKLYFLEKLRETISFGTPEELKDQITGDIHRAEEMAEAGFRPFRKGFLEKTP